MGTRRRNNLEDLTPDKRAKVEAMLARRRPPSIMAEEIRDREALARELRDTGHIATTGRPVDLQSLLELRRFISRLREYREKAGITLAEVAERSGIDKAALSRLERGATNPTFETLSRYVQALGLVTKLDFAEASP
jgi:DNA-binding phage protein